MATYRGSGGKVETTSTDLDAISWTLEATSDLAEVTELGDTFKAYVAGLVDWSATVECIMKTETDPSSLVGTIASLKLYIDGTHYFEANALCVSSNPRVGIDGAAMVTYAFEGADGAAGITFN